MGLEDVVDYDDGQVLPLDPGVFFVLFSFSLLVKA